MRAKQRQEKGYPSSKGLSLDALWKYSIQNPAGDSPMSDIMSLRISMPKILGTFPQSRALDLEKSGEAANGSLSHHLGLLRNGKTSSKYKMQKIKKLKNHISRLPTRVSKDHPLKKKERTVLSVGHGL